MKYLIIILTIGMLAAGCNKTTTPSADTTTSKVLIQINQTNLPQVLPSRVQPHLKNLPVQTPPQKLVQLRRLLLHQHQQIMVQVKRNTLPPKLQRQIPKVTVLL